MQGLTKCLRDLQFLILTVRACRRMRCALVEQAEEAQVRGR